MLLVNVHCLIVGVQGLMLGSGQVKQVLQCMPLYTVITHKLRNSGILWQVKTNYMPHYTTMSRKLRKDGILAIPESQLAERERM